MMRKARRNARQTGGVPDFLMPGQYGEMRESNDDRKEMESMSGKRMIQAHDKLRYRQVREC